MANVDVDWAGAADAQEKVFQPGIELFVLKAILNHWLLKTMHAVQICNLLFF